MKYGDVPFEQRIKENIRNYSLDNLYDMNTLTSYLKAFAALTGLELLLTGRHGEKILAIGSFTGFTPDVVGEPGIKIRVCDRTIAHLYVHDGAVPAEKKSQVEALLSQTVNVFSHLGTEAYLQRESAIYVDELEEKLKENKDLHTHGEKEDVLTGVFHKLYFEERMQIIDRAEVAPVAVINVNINDWKYVNDHYGDEESDRLIRTVADLVKQEAKPEYVIGRVDGDVFIILIPLAEIGEAEEYCKRLQAACLSYEDPILAPSVACGVVYKENVEETIADKLPDAEYEMFNNKFEIKNAPGYRERLEKGQRK